VDVFKRLQQVATACLWLMLVLAFGGVLGGGPDVTPAVSVDVTPLLAGLGVAAVGAAAITVSLLTELDHPALSRTGPVSDVARLVYFGGITGVLFASHGVEGPLWILYVPMLLATAIVDRPWKSLGYAYACAALALAATAGTHELARANLLRLLLILPAFPAVVWFTNTLANSVSRLAAAADAERIRQVEEVEQLRADLVESARAEREALLDETRRERAELKVKVERLSESLANAASGDLSDPSQAWEAAVSESDETMTS
jgi:hypothetical protein